MNALTDEQLAAIVARRDKSSADCQAAKRAMQDLYLRHAPKLLPFLFARARHRRDVDVEDLHQALWARLWEKLPTAFDGRHFRGWLYQVARHALTDRLRRKAPAQLGGENPPAPPVVPQTEADERMAALQKCLAKLPPEAAELVKARLTGESYADICTKYDLKPAQAHKMFHDAKVKLQACVKKVVL